MPHNSNFKTPGEIDRDTAARYTRRFYRDVLTSLEGANVPVLVGGAFAFSHFTGIQRPTKDFDLFIRREHLERALATLADAGFHTELTFPHWLAKARSDEFLVDLIFGSGNGVAPVDDAWFAHAVQAEAVGVPVLLCPAEELLWSKAFVMERERYDGADVTHILHTQGARLDWARVMERFGENWRVLLASLVLFGFVYPGEEQPAPRWVMDTLLARLDDEIDSPPRDERICRGTLISREQYLVDVTEWGYADGRMQPRGSMSASEIAHWTEAIGKG
ncbi:MAG TPA: nucleotidyltransferase [Gemmatimonadaceae bacterium]|nr:nucleotidyltransferase [Gemmatimonadaceae bacterium]